ncbi:MAG: ABC transporter ATP-binding protein [Actinomycetes bacterium]
MLRVDEVVVRFGGVIAVDGLSLEVPLGTVTGLIGPNGSGKTTTFDVITGLRRPTRGRVTWQDDEITAESPAARARRGIGRTFQRLELFGSLTVRDNVLVAAEAQGNQRSAGAVTDEVLERLGLTDVAHAPTDVVPTGLARLVELGRALVRRPSLLLLDEPGSGLDAQESTALGDLLQDIAGDGVGVLVVEHDMDLIMRVCQHIYVLDLGKVIASGTPAEVQGDRLVRQAYLGDPAEGARLTVIPEVTS